MSKIIDWILCLVGVHQWTSKSREGKQLLHPGMTSREISLAFQDYYRAYCKRCGHVSGS